MKTKKIETGLRNVKQSFRKFKTSDRQRIIREVQSLPKGKKTEYLNGLNIKSLYYAWEKRYPELFKGVKRTYVPTENVKMVNKMGRPMNVKTTGKQTHTVTLSVEVGSIMELISFCSSIVSVPKVKSVLSVE